MNGIVSLAVLLVVLGYSQATLPGGWEEVSVDDAKVREIAGWAAGAMGNNYELLEITKAEKQVVAGMNYRLAIRFGLGEGLQTTCIVTVWEKLDGTREIQEPTACTY